MLRTVAIALVCFACSAASAEAATTIGQIAPSGSTGTCISCSFIQRQTATGSTSYTVPADGVIVSWSIRGGTSVGQARLRVWRPDGSNRFELVSESAFSSVAVNSAASYPASLAVDAGDQLGLMTGSPPGGIAGTYTSSSGDDITWLVIGGPTIGQTVGTGGDFGASSSGARHVNASATIEPDADGDGLGDESQDPCVGACPQPPGPSDSAAPDTLLDKGPKRRIETDERRAKVKLRFSSEDPSATFQCRLDRKPFAPCTSPVKLRAKLGKHRFYVQATDPAGNVDGTPLRVRFKIVEG